MLIILGCGYIGSRLARAALAQGRAVRVCARNASRLAPLAELGAEVVAFDATKHKAFGRAMAGTSGATVVWSLPLLTEIPAGGGVRGAATTAKDSGARAFIYLGSCGLYGKRADDDAVIDEDSPLAGDDLQMQPYRMDEMALQSMLGGDLRTVVLRVAPVYGVGRGVRARLRKGDYKLIDDGAHWTPRIHVDDLVQVIFAAETRGPAGETYLVCDDKPTRQREYAEWLCARLGVPVPESGPTLTVRGRYLKNEKMKRELGIELKYPTFVEGEAQIEAEEALALP